MNIVLEILLDQVISACTACYKLLHSLKRSDVSVHSVVQPHTLPRSVLSFLSLFRTQF